MGRRDGGGGWTEGRRDDELGSWDEAVQAACPGSEGRQTGVSISLAEKTRHGQAEPGPPGPAWPQRSPSLPELGISKLLGDGDHRKASVCEGVCLLPSSLT